MRTDVQRGRAPCAGVCARSGPQGCCGKARPGRGRVGLAGEPGRTAVPGRSHGRGGGGRELGADSLAHAHCTAARTGTDPAALGFLYSIGRMTRFLYSQRPTRAEVCVVDHRWPRRWHGPSAEVRVDVGIRIPARQRGERDHRRASMRTLKRKVAFRQCRQEVTVRGGRELVPKPNSPWGLVSRRVGGRAVRDREKRATPRTCATRGVQRYHGTPATEGAGQWRSDMRAPARGRRRAAPDARGQGQ